MSLLFVSELPHTQGNSGNFQIIKNLREIQENSRNFYLFLKLKAVLIFSLKFQGSY